MSTSSAANFADLLPPSWAQVIPQWLAEDCPSFDYGGFVVGSAPREATLWAKSAGILAGRPFFDEVFRVLGCEVQWFVEEGSEVGKQGEKVKVATVKGEARKLLLGERVALNTLARCSGIATA
jgi:nicotinate-nucleotide pyrophosphorylase (carboxylating)